MSSVHSRITNGQPQANFYEGGRYTRTNRDFYNANQPFEDTASPDRDTLRARARWIHENNPIVSNIDDSLKNNIIGKGLKFQFKTENEALNKEVEQRWAAAKESLDITGREHFDAMCGIILGNRFMDGEVPIYTPLVKEGGSYHLRLQPLEVDRFALGRFDIQNGMFFDGIETNRYGKPTRYHFSNDLFRQATIKGKGATSDVVIPADKMIYYFKADNRFTQYRGISEYKQIILDLKNFAAQMRATIEAARARANISYIVTNEGGNVRPTGTTGGVRSEGDRAIRDINGIMVKYLKNGESITKLDPDMAGDNFKDFVKEVVRLIATGRKISYELAFRDYSQVNYSSARASILQDHKRFDAEFVDFSNKVYKPVFMRWFETEILKNSFRNITPKQFYADKYAIKAAVRLTQPKRDWVDPQKDVKAVSLALDYGLTTLTREHARQGADFEEIVLERKRELEFMNQHGLMGADQDTKSAVKNTRFEKEESDG